MYKSHVKDSDGYDDIIFSYTAEQAVEDGILADVTEMAHEAGFSKNFKVRVTRHVYDVCTPPKSNRYESFDGRMWDVLWMGMNSIKRNSGDNFCQYVVRIGRRNVTLFAKLDTTSGPAIHIMFPEDD